MNHTFINNEQQEVTVTIGKIYSAMGTCGMTDGVKVTGTLTEVQNGSTAIIIDNKTCIPCQVNLKTLKPLVPYVVGNLIIAQITSNSLLHEVEKALKDLECFIDNEENEEKIYYGDVFEGIIGIDSEAPKLSKKALNQLEELNDQCSEFNYIQIINA